jgi:hypothetical protein
MRFFSTRKKTFFLAAAILFFSSFKSSAQAIDSMLNIYANVFQQEKIYIQFDKPAYAPGETVWFKAYLMAGIYPSDISKNFYADWSDENGNILTHTTTPILHESARGQFEIPAGFTGNTIYIKAYTKWMLNFDSAFLYQKLIRVIQKNSSKTVAAPVVATIKFFAEGGDAVAGIKNKIAFKANDQFGKPVKIKGTILNSKGSVIDSFKAAHDGMGYFFLQPQPNESYTAKWFDEQKNIHQTALPQVKQEGVVLQINISDSSRDFLVTRTDNAAENLKQLHIVATEQQQLVYMAKMNLTNKNFVEGSIPVGQLATGVLQITLFDANWQPLAERITFVNNNDAEFNPEAGFSVLGLGKRGRNVLIINVPDSIESNLSVSVTDAGIGVDTSDNIISHLLLTGDLHGAVYNPFYYFSEDKDVSKNLDLVMLTHGWRRFNWQNVVQGKLPDLKYSRDTAFLNFSGKVFGASASQLREAKYIFTIIRAKDSSQHTLTIPLQSNGTFYKPEMIFYDTLKIFYQFPSPNMAEMTAVTFFNGLLDASKHLYIDDISANSVTALDTGGTYRNFYLAQEQQRLKLLSQVGLMKEVIVKAREKSPLQKMDEKYTSGLFSGEGDNVQFDVLDDKSAFAFPGVINYLQGKVAGLMITIGSDNVPSLQWRGETPTIYLNEMSVDATQIQNLSMNDVAYIKVFRPPFTGGMNDAGGAIAVYTKKGNDRPNNDTKSKGIPYKFVAGYTPIKEFYSPNYGTYDQKNEATDVRSTLYWNPMIFTTQAKHTLRFEFYNNDVTNSFRVVLEGMSKDGRLAHIEKVVE